MHKIHIAYIVHSLAIGGAEKYVVDLAQSLDRERFQASIFCMTKGGDLQQSVPDDVKVHELNKKAGNQLKFPFHMARKLKKENVHIVHSNNWGTQGETLLAGKLARKKVVHTQHGLEKSDQESTRRRAMRNRARGLFARFTDHLVAVSEATRNFMCSEWKVAQDRVCLIPNGVNPIIPDPEARAGIRRELGIAENEVLIGSVGRLMQVKNYPCLLQAFARLHRNGGFQGKLIFVGDGGERENLENLASQLGIKEKTIFAGFRSNVHQFLQAMDIFVLPSFSEGMSLALLEAMSASLPVVATDVGGNSEIVEHNRTGFIIPSDNHQALARALGELVASKDVMCSMGRQGREGVLERFSHSKMIKSYATLYQSFDMF